MVNQASVEPSFFAPSASVGSRCRSCCSTAEFYKSRVCGVRSSFMSVMHLFFVKIHSSHRPLGSFSSAAVRCQLLES
ncbi:unnamed protein product [Citrullus colocynthis]|uniref:Uncharacterized protein n=1 Tax=Citrullus colocynthis TaxID=252529 RepID=A0ABP0Y0Q3_9ROSI